jgi:hypothetical protein
LKKIFNEPMKLSKLLQREFGPHEVNEEIVYGEVDGEKIVVGRWYRHKTWIGDIWGFIVYE